MESEKVKEIKEWLENEVFIATKFGDVSRRVPTIDLRDTLTLINELESENEALQKGVIRLKKRYEETITKNADECVKKFCETSMYKEQEKLVNENTELKDRIAKLESENERLLEQRNKTYNIWVKDTEKLKDRITELEKEAALIKNSVYMRDYQTLEELSNNKVKQFTEMLKEKSGKTNLVRGEEILETTCHIKEQVLYETLKEVLGEE